MRAHLVNTPATKTEEDYVPVVVCVDDTDDVTKSTSTGEVASLIAKEARALNGQLRLEITRHQLLIRDDVPYTSHNSAMAFEVLLPSDSIDEFRRRAIQVIDYKRAATSDPGLCLACVPSSFYKSGEDRDENSDEITPQICDLISFGRRAKVDFCSIQSAYDLAQRIPWVTLSEHGGDGSGVVGALAGVGLRLSGEDGRFRGKWDFAKLCSGESSPTVETVTHRLEHDFRGPVRIVDTQGESLSTHIPFSLDDEAKPILNKGALTLVCDLVDGIAHPCSKVDLGDIGNVSESWSRVCSEFEWDNDSEEFIDHTPSCRNCLHRRWVPEGFQCVKNLVAQAT